ncbi:hypothetical protein Tco_0415282 [Tanacetum coccineum]
MSSPPAPSNTKTISSAGEPAGEARGSPVPTPFPNDLYMLEPHPLSLTLVPPSPDYTPTTPHTDEELEPLETSENRVTSSPSTTSQANLTTLPSSQQPPLTLTSATLTPP